MPFTFSLPFCLLLPDGDYQVTIEEKDIVTLRLVKKIPDSYDERLGMRGLTPNDLKGYDKVGALNVDNEFKGDRARRLSVDEILSSKEILLIRFFVKDGQNHAPPMQLVLNQELQCDPYGRFRYTKVTFISDNNDNLIERAVASINKLIVSYRLHTNHFWVAPIRKKDIEVFEKDGKPAAYSPLITFMADVDHRTIDAIKVDLGLGVPFEIPSHMLYLDALNAREQMNYTLCIIYAVTAIESLIKFYLSSYSHVRKIRKDSLDDLIRMPIRNLVSVVLPLLISKDELPDKMIADFIHINAVRNDIIHEAEQTIKQDDADKAIEITEQFNSLLAPKINALLKESLYKRIAEK